MINIEWLIEEREIPNIGILQQGQKYILPDELAKSLIKQKQARLIKRKTNKIDEENGGQK